MNDADSAYLQYLLDVTEPSLNISEHRKYAWDYFQLHSTQRIATFNFFVSIATAISAAAGIALQANVNLRLAAMLLGFLLCLISFVFWKLDERNRQLIKLAEEALKMIEAQLNPSFDEISLFSRDEQRVRTYRAQNSYWFWRNYYSYSQSFNTLFLCFGALGLTSMIIGLVLL